MYILYILYFDTTCVYIYREIDTYYCVYYMYIIYILHIRVYIYIVYITNIDIYIYIQINIQMCFIYIYYM